MTCGYYSIDKRILHRILMESLDKYWPRPSATAVGVRPSHPIGRYLIEVILFANPRRCYVLECSDWDGLPASE